MNKFSLYRSMTSQGTLAEAAKDIPDARFALPSAINWVHALSILIQHTRLSYGTAMDFYAAVRTRNARQPEINSVFEQLLFALNQLAALEAIRHVPNKADIARVSIVTWYYGLYGSASAMVASSDGSFQETHAATAAQWDRQLAQPALVMAPFSDRISSLVPTTVKSEVESLRSRGRHSLTKKPGSPSNAWGCVTEYLSGTADWERYNVEANIKREKEFRERFSDFRKKDAQAYRDARLQRRSVCFLHQASRYRGKANYRDAIYLAYGTSNAIQLTDFVDHLAITLRAFLTMAGAYSGRRLGAETWEAFLLDLDQKRSISISPYDVWSS